MLGGMRLGFQYEKVVTHKGVRHVFAEHKHQTNIKIASPFFVLYFLVTILALAICALWNSELSCWRSKKWEIEEGERSYSVRGHPKNAVNMEWGRHKFVYPILTAGLTITSVSFINYDFFSQRIFYLLTHFIHSTNILSLL